jgi:phosphatidylserine/phosphatidylglycerophosphate/cardiolipin synthase-like enzyme
VDLSSWFLTATERGNPATRLDDRHPGDAAWSEGNEVRPLIHGAAYFAELLAAVRAARRGDLLLFTDWRGDPDELLAGPGTEVSRVFCTAAERGVVVKGLVWRSHWDRLQFSATENRHLGEEIERAGGECLLDMRVRPGGSHHQKFVVLRYQGRPEQDVAFVGGIDLCHSRHDDARHEGDPQTQPIAAVYGKRPPWHDLQLAVRGPAVADVEAVFRERWEDPRPLSRSPMRGLGDRLRGDDRRAGPLPPPAPAPQPAGSCSVQLLRTYPFRRPGYVFAPDGERSVARGYGKAIRRARTLIYLEDQYLWSARIVEPLAAALREQPGLHLVAVIPLHPDQDGRVSMPPNLVGRDQALAVLREAGGNRVAVYGPENHAGTPVYVHAKACVIDDVWASVGSDNLNRRSWTHDSELCCAVLDATRDQRQPADPAGLGDGARRYARDLRLNLAAEHLDRDPEDLADLLDPRSAFDAFARSAAALDAWHAAGRSGPRPSGRLRTYRAPAQGPLTRAWAGLLYRTVYDPDGRPAPMRGRDAF